MTRSSRSSAVRSPSPFGEIFPHQDIAGRDFGADADDAVLIEIFQPVFADIRNIARDDFRSKLGVADIDGEILDVDRALAITLHDPLGNDDGVFIVVAFPRHECDEHILSESEFAVFRRSAIRQEIAFLDRICPFNTRGIWFMQVNALDFSKLWSGYVRSRCSFLEPAGALERTMI